jgi:hypothetical protein
MTDVFAVTSDGTISFLTHEPDQEPPKRQSCHAEIRSKFSDKHQDTFEIRRLINQEILNIIEKMAECEDDPTKTHFRATARAEINALKALNAQVVSAARAEVREDVLNLDGPKFKFVLTSMIKLFEEASRQALGKDKEHLVDSIMRHYRDLVAMHEPEIRATIAKMDRDGSVSANGRGGGSWVDQIPKPESTD